MNTIPLHTGLAAEHVRQALDYRQAAESGDALSARYEAESFRAARKAAQPEPETIPFLPALLLAILAEALLAMLFWGVLKMVGAI